MLTKKDRLSGIVDMTGQEIVPPMYDTLGGDYAGLLFEGGYQAALEGGKLRFLNRDGQVSASVDYELKENDWKGLTTNSFNISTTSSIVIASGGVKVAKHGNRAASSKSGAADCLEALGVDITINEKRSKQLLNDINICFLFAQNYHLAMKYVAPVRKELGIRTVFNILGPLTNPAGATYQVMGVYDEALVEPLAQVLSNLGVKRAMVVYGKDGLDEISASDETFVCEINEGTFKTYTIFPEQFGLQRCLKEELIGGTPKENAQITLDVLSGKQGGPRTAVLMNAGAGLYVGGKVNSLKAGVDLAAELIDSGKAKDKLEEFIKESNK